MSAVAQVLNNIAGQLFTAVEVLHTAIGNEDLAAAAAACALIEQSGALADAAGAALGALRVADPADWNLSPSAAEAMKTLEAAAR